MNDGFSFESSITCSEFFRISWVDLGYIPGDRRQNLKRISLRHLSKVNLLLALTCEKGLRGRARCVVPGVSAAVAIAAWLGRALAVGVRKLLHGLDV